MAFNFGENLRKIRIQQGLTQKEVGARMGISEQGYSRFERLEIGPKTSSVSRIAEALGVNPETLLGGPMAFDSAVDLMLHLRTFNNGSALDRFAPAELIAAAIAGYEDGSWINPGILAKILLTSYHLNQDGRQKALEQLELLSKIPEYQRPEPEKPLETQPTDDE